MPQSGQSLPDDFGGRRVRAGGAELHVVERGAGKPILLIHGFPLDHSMWNPQIERLAERARVIAPDLRGFGGSRSAGGAASIEQMADDLDALLTALAIDEPVVLCGLSMGGYVAFQFWRKHGSRLRGLILCDTRSVADTPEGAQARSKQAKTVLSEGSASLAAAMLPKLFAPSTFENQPNLVEEQRQVILNGDRVGIAAALRAMAARPDVGDYLPRIAIPALVIVGQHDAISPPDEMRSLAQAMPRAQFVMLPDCGHMSPLENPQAFHRAVETYLDRVDGGSAD
jgi:3-oxoadipate enol-lactonase